MTPLGWICMVCSLAFVWSLCGWCYYRILKAPQPPVEEVSRLHSA